MTTVNINPGNDNQLASAERIISSALHQTQEHLLTTMAVPPVNTAVLMLRAAVTYIADVDAAAARELLMTVGPVIHIEGPEHNRASEIASGIAEYLLRREIELMGHQPPASEEDHDANRTDQDAG